jgi:hypothetical protein
VADVGMETASVDIPLLIDHFIDDFYHTNRDIGAVDATSV